MKKRVKRIAQLCVTLAMFCVMMLVVSATSNTTTSTTPRLTFTNEKDTKLTLTVTKTVDNQTTSATPDDEFTFQILLDGNVDDELTYTLTDENGDEWVYAYCVKNNTYYAPDGETEIDFDNLTDAMRKAMFRKVSDLASLQYYTIPLTPDDNGYFTLKDGWTAVFSSSNMRIGKTYTVTETTNGKINTDTKIYTPNGKSYYYIPQSADLSVDIKSDSNDNKADFVNTYVPASNTLQVSKKIFNAGASDYTLPSTPSFTYRLRVNKEDYAKKEYTLYDSATGKYTTGLKTDENGEFTLTGGQTATFKDLRKDQVYDLYEYAQTGWICVGGTAGTDTVDGDKISYSDKRDGVIGQASVQEFQNRLASFIVKKTCDNAGDTEFTFVLKDEKGTPWSGQAYYLCDNNSVGDTVMYTDANGCFTLQANRSAMFIGIDVGKKYTVTELTSPLYECTYPTNGTTTDTVDSNQVDIVTFENEMLETNGLYISKLANNEDTIKTSTTDEITYTLKLVKVTTDATTNVEVETPITANATKASTNSNDKEEELEIGTDGKFTLKSGDYAHFTKLETGNYRVYEIGINKKDLPTAQYTDSNQTTTDMTFELDTTNTTTTSNSVKLASTFKVNPDGSQQLAITNTYSTKMMFKISKTILDYKGASLNDDGSSKNANSHIEKDGDTSQRFVYKIEKYKDKATWESENGTPESVTYTDFSCDKTGNGYVLVQGSGAGWYVITELDTWSGTDYDYKGEEYYQGSATNIDETTYANVAKDDTKKCVAFQLEKVYDAYNLPEAHFENEESQYAYRSGQAYADNKIE